MLEGDGFTMGLGSATAVRFPLVVSALCAKLVNLVVAGRTGDVGGVDAGLGDFRWVRFARTGTGVHSSDGL